MPKITVTLIVTHQKHIHILMFLYSAPLNKIHESTIYIYVDPEPLVISLTAYAINQHEDQYNVQHH
jgi:hypothetical protein